MKEKRENNKNKAWKKKDLKRKKVEGVWGQTGRRRGQRATDEG